MEVRGTHAGETSRRKKPSLLRRIAKEFNEHVPTPSPRPSDKEFAAGHHTVGIVRYAVPDEAPEGGHLDDDLVIHIKTIDDGQPLTLPRTVRCPLPSGTGHKLVGATVRVCHTTYDRDYDNDILVTEWPPEVAEARKPLRYRGPGAVRARIWAILSGFFFVIGYAGVMFTPVLLFSLIVGSFTGTDILPQVHPAVALGVGIAVIPAGVFAGCVCATRCDTLREGMTPKGTMMTSDATGTSASPWPSVHASAWRKPLGRPIPPRG